MKSKSNPNRPKRNMSFEEVVNSEYRILVEQIEWGCSDIEIMDRLVEELYQQTGYYWVREVQDPNATPQVGMFLGYPHERLGWVIRKVKKITTRYIAFEDEDTSQLQLPWFNTHRKDFTLYY